MSWACNPCTDLISPIVCGVQEELFIKFAEFEEKCKEIDRARAIYKYALDHIPKSQADAVYQRFVGFEKQHGDREGIEVITRVLFQPSSIGSSHHACVVQSLYVNASVQSGVALPSCRM